MKKYRLLLLKNPINFILYYFIFKWGIKNMKKIYTLIISFFFILNGLGVVALNSEVEEFEDKNIDTMKNNNTNFEYSHTVFIEIGTATWCPSCPASNSLWHEMYEEDIYDFEYCEMIVDKNSGANSRMNDYNLYWVPTSYFDGGENVYPGTYKNYFKFYLDASGERIVQNLVGEILCGHNSTNFSYHTHCKLH